MIGFKIKTAIVYCWAKLTFGDAVYIGNDDNFYLAIARTSYNPISQQSKIVYHRTIKPTNGDKKRRVKNTLNPNGDINGGPSKWVYVNKSKRTESILKRD